MPTITIEITYPNDTDVQVRTPQGASAPEESNEYTYFHDYLKDNGRGVFTSAAHLDTQSDEPYTLEQIAEHKDLRYASVLSMHRSTGRTAKVWRRDWNVDAPIVLVEQGHVLNEETQTWRKTYRLPEGVAELILGF